MTIITDKVYFVVLVDGVPEAVTTIWDRADLYARELTTKNRSAVIVPCQAIPTQEQDSNPLL